MVTNNCWTVSREWLPLNGLQFDAHQRNLELISASGSYEWFPMNLQKNEKQRFLFRILYFIDIVLISFNRQTAANIFGRLKSESNSFKELFNNLDFLDNLFIKVFDKMTKQKSIIQIIFDMCDVTKNWLGFGFSCPWICKKNRIRFFLNELVIALVAVNYWPF